jgi:dephospho-CoA kinase
MFLREIYENFLFSEELNLLLERGRDLDERLKKVFFVTGSPGCGKNYVISRIFPPSPLKIVDIDIIFDLLITKYKPVMYKLEKYRDYDSPEFNELYKKAKLLMKKSINQYVKSNLGLIISATGKKYEKVVEMKNFFEMNGYETFLIFVDCELKTALERNRSRSRTVPEEFLKKAYENVQKNLIKYRELFGNQNILIINNNSNKEFLMKERYYTGMIRKFLTRPTRNLQEMNYRKVNKHSILGYNKFVGLKTVRS